MRKVFRLLSIIFLIGIIFWAYIFFVFYYNVKLKNKTKDEDEENKQVVEFEYDNYNDIEKEMFDVLIEDLL